MAQSSPNAPAEDTPLLEDHNEPESGVLVRVEHPRPQAVRKRRTSCFSFGCCFWVSLALILLAIILIPLYLYLVFSVGFSGCPPDSPLCWPWKSSEPYGPVPDLRNSTFAVGFHFTAGYGTAAIYYSNGTNVTVGRYEGDQVYKDYMAAISYHEAEHPTPPYYGADKASADAWRQWKRYWRKRGGIPPSIEVEALVNVLNGLKPDINRVLGDHGPFEFATIAVPALPAMYNEDISDAAKYAGFQLVSAWRGSGDSAQYPITDVNFAYAGMNLTLGAQNLLSVGYTRDMLTVHLCPRGCTSYSHMSSRGVADPLLGNSAIGSYESQEDYWLKVGEAIRSVLDRKVLVKVPVDKVVVHGDLAMNKRLRKVLHQELNTSQPYGDKLALWSFDSTFAGALGAAKLGLGCMLDDFWGKDGRCFPDLRVQPQGW